MANDKLAQTAEAGIYSDWAPLGNGWCQKFVRLCIQKVYGAKYDAYHKASAKESALAWQAAGLAMTPQQAGKLQPGDILYKVHGSGGYGHVGIFIGDDKVAENASATSGRVRGALGFRTVERFGAFDLLVRLTPPHVTKPVPPARLILAIKKAETVSYDHIKSATLKDGKFQVDPAELTKVLLGEDPDIRSLLKAFGWDIYQEGNHLSDASDPRQYLFIEKAAK